MLILSQDKSLIVNLNNTSHIYIDTNGTNIMCCCEVLIRLGRYSSIERCKEIMQDILTAYQSMEEDKYYLIGNKSITTPKCTYMMPEE